MTDIEIGQALKQARQQKKMTLKQVAEAMTKAGQYSIVHSNIVAYEQGKNNFTSKFITEYCKAIGCSFKISIK